MSLNATDPDTITIKTILVGPQVSILHWSPGVQITLVPRCPNYTGPQVSKLHWSPGVQITLVPRCPYYTGPQVSKLHWSPGVHITLVPRCPNYTGPKVSLIHRFHYTHIVDHTSTQQTLWLMTQDLTNSLYRLLGCNVVTEAHNITRPTTNLSVCMCVIM